MKIISLMIVALVAAGCSASVSIGGGPDFDELEDNLTTSIKEQYSNSGFELTEEVVCPRPEEELEEGDTFTCTVAYEDQSVRIEVTVEPDDEVSFETLDYLYKMEVVEQDLSVQLTEAVSLETTVTCAGARIRAIPHGESFDCQATDANGDTATVRVTTDTEVGYTWKLL